MSNGGLGGDQGCGRILCLPWTCLSNITSWEIITGVHSQCHSPIQWLHYNLRHLGPSVCAGAFSDAANLKLSAYKFDTLKSLLWPPQECTRIDVRRSVFKQKFWNRSLWIPLKRWCPVAAREGDAELRGGEGQKGRGREVTKSASPCKYPGSTTAGHEVENFINAFDTNVQSISPHTVALQATVPWVSAEIPSSDVVDSAVQLQDTTVKEID